MRIKKRERVGHVVNSQNGRVIVAWENGEVSVEDEADIVVHEDDAMLFAMIDTYIHFERAKN